MALGIPLVVRAKRRYRQGKPLFKLGSHQSTEDLTKEKPNGFLKTVESREPDWYTNTVFNYEDEVVKEKSQFTKDIISISKHQSANEGKHKTILKVASDKAITKPPTDATSQL